jgi:hypothetical protein
MVCPSHQCTRLRTELAEDSSRRASDERQAAGGSSFPSKQMPQPLNSPDLSYGATGQGSVDCVTVYFGLWDYHIKVRYQDTGLYAPSIISMPCYTTAQRACIG